MYGKDNLRMLAEDSRYYNILRNEIDDVVHWWRQFCLNWECLVSDLQRLSKVYVTNADSNDTYLVTFRKEFPILFECIEAVFGLMMSNSRLCEQIHGMMRKVLRLGTGQEEADKHRAYSTGTDFEMKEERRAMVPGKKNVKRRKAKRHSSTKAQHIQHSKQLCERSKAFSLVAEPLFGGEKVPSRRQVHTAGRRAKDKELSQQQMNVLMKKRDRSRRDELTLQDVLREAKTLKPTNDLVLQSTDETIERRIRVKEMAVVKFWDKMRDKRQYKCMFTIAKRCFPLLEHFTFEHGVVKSMVNGKVTRRIQGLPKVLRGRENLQGIPNLGSVVTSKTAATKLIG